MVFFQNKDIIITYIKVFIMVLIIKSKNNSTRFMVTNLTITTYHLLLYTCMMQYFF